MNAPLRRGLCPTLAMPMRTGDGLLARLKPVTSGLTPKTLIGLCESALRHGNGIVEVTARGSLQVRGLTARSAGSFAAEVDALGIEVRAGVPVQTGPLAGLDPAEAADPRPLAEGIRCGISAAGLEGRLGPKVSVVVDGGGYSDLKAVAADVRLTAERDDAGIRWQVAIGGDFTSAEALGSFGKDSAFDAALTILAEIAEIGREGRAKDLSRQSLEKILDKLEPEGSAKECGALRPPRKAQGVILPLTDGRFAVPVALPFGHIHVRGLIDLLARAESLGTSEIRLAPRRTLLFLCPAEMEARAVRQAAERAGLVMGADDPRSRIAACPGSPACTSGHIPARAMAAEIAAAMPDSLDLHVSGCEKRCASPGHDGLTLLGFRDAAALAIESEGRSPVAFVVKESASAAFTRVARLVLAEKRPGESEAACLARIGKDRLIQTFGQEP